MSGLFSVLSLLAENLFLSGLCFFACACVLYCYPFYVPTLNVLCFTNSVIFHGSYYYHGVKTKFIIKVFRFCLYQALVYLSRSFYSE